MPTLTINQTLEVFRANQVRLGVEALQRGIQEGIFPFGTCIPGRGRDTYLIWRKLLDDWLAEHIENPITSSTVME